MVLLVDSGAFDKTTATGPVTQPVTLNFQPKAIILYTNGIVSGTSQTDGYVYAMGFADTSGNNRSVAVASADARTGGTGDTTNARRRASDTKCLSIINDAGAVLCECQLDSTSQNGFVLNWTTNDANAYQIFYKAYGGDDITNVRVGTFTNTTTDGQNQDVALDAPQFKPDVVFLLGNNQNSTSVNTSSTTAAISFSAATGQAEQGCVLNWVRHNLATSSCASFQATDRCYASGQTTTNTTLTSAASFVATTDTGFTINWVSAQTAVAAIFYLCIKGGSWKVGSFNSATATGTSAITGVPFQPKSLMYISTGRPASTTPLPSAALSIGTAVASTDQQVVAVAETDNVAPTVNARSLSSNNTRILRKITAAATGNASTIDIAATLSALNSNGFTNNWVTVDTATPRQIIYIAAGDASATGPSIVSSTTDLRYNIYNNVAPAYTQFPYHMGGRVSPDALQTHTFNILGALRVLTRFDYNIVNQITKLTEFQYHVGFSTTVITKLTEFQYNIISQLGGVGTSLKVIYDIEEADIFKTGFGKPWRGHLIITDTQNRRQLHTYNSFRPQESDIKVEEFECRLASDSAGDFSVKIEDHAGVIDPTVVGNGCKIFFRAAKREEQLFDGEHNLFWGIVKQCTTIREDTGTLQYSLEGFGRQVEFNERITNFKYTARRKSITDPTPDTQDSSMFAFNLMKKLVTATDHLPIGGPPMSFSVKGVVDNPDPVDDFLSDIDEPFVEASSVANTIADTTGSVWGVDANGDVFLHYPTLEHSGITIMSGTGEAGEGTPTDVGELGITTGGTQPLSNMSAEQLAKTAFLIGSWSYTDSTSKDDGFTNRFFGKVGRKEVVGNNVINISAVREKYTPLYSDTGFSQDTSGGGGGGGNKIAPNPADDIIREPSKATAGVYLPFFKGFSTPDAQLNSPEEEEGFNILANTQRRYPTVKIVAGNDFLQGTRATSVNWDTASGQDTIQWWTNHIRLMQDAGVTCLIDVSGDRSVLTQQQILDDINVILTRFPDCDGIELSDVDNTDETLYKEDYKAIANYVRTTKGKRFMTFINKKRPPTSVWQIEIPWADIMLAFASNGSALGRLPQADNIANNAPWFHDIPLKRRFILMYDVNANTGITESQIRLWMNDVVANDVASYFTVDDEPSPRQFKAVPDWIDVVASEVANMQRAGGGSGGGTPETSVPSLRDLAQSFTAKSTDLSDIMVLVSKVGNPKWRTADDANRYKPYDYFYPDTLHGHIETNKITTTQTTDPETGAVETTVVEQPSGEYIISFGIPFDEIGTTPTTKFISNILTLGKVIPDRRYWLVLHGTGQNEQNTIRWHHSDSPTQDSFAAERIPGGHRIVKDWNVFSGSGTNFSLSYFDRKLDFIEASDSDSIERFGLTESMIDLSDIDDELLAARFLQSLLNQASKQKRMYDIGTIMAPDPLLIPGKLVTILDEKSGHSHNGIQPLDAEIVEVTYHFSAYEHPLGCYYAQVKPIGYVDYSYQVWKRKLDRGEIGIPAGDDVITPPAPPSTPPPPPPGPPPPPPPTGEPPPPPPPPTPPPPSPPPPPPPSGAIPLPADISSAGLTRQRGPFDNYTDFITAVNNAQPGDDIILANGTYTVPSSVDASFSRSGTATNPIVVRAQTVGGVTLQGTEGRYTFSDCTYFTWYGFIHRHDDTGDDAMSISGGNNVRFARCDVALNNSSNTVRSHWLIASSTRNCRIDHNYFHDKSTQGSFVQVNESSSEVPAGQGLLIEYNRFSHQDNQFQASGGVGDHGESLQIGSSDQSRRKFKVTFRYNYVDENKGDGETITNKSCGNTYFNNTFVNSQSLSLRHGDTATVIGNYFENTGLRLGGANNIVACNCSTLNSRTSSARKPLCIQIGNVDRPTGSGTGYERVVDNMVILNTFANGAGTASPVIGWGTYDQGDQLPLNVTFRGNIITAENGTLFSFAGGATGSGSTITDNIAFVSGSASYGDITTGMAQRTDPQITRASDRIYRINDTNSPAYAKVSASSNVFSSTVTKDIDGETIASRTPAGCDWFSTAGAYPAKPKKRITVSDTGPSGTIDLGNI